MGKIRLLDDNLANKIAAGEVVERPASIVKELVENSIDAGSTKIDINIKESGLAYINVKDNGEGMDEEDIEKAFLRHSTSKLKNENDLFRINTLGFRGEALASMVAVSHLTLRSSTDNSGKGIKVNLEGGKVKHKEVIAFVNGTEICVENLFYNTPARLKYMKSLQTELGHIIDYVNKLSLAYPFISFTLNHNGRLLIKTSGNNKLNHVISAIYGTAIAKKMIPFNSENLDYTLEGYISKPELNRANKSHINIFINGRYIKNFQLGQAVIRGYKTLLMLNRFPIAVLNIRMDPSLIDVNVHPAKLEAKLSKEQELIKFIEDTVNNALREETFIKEPLNNQYFSSNNQSSHQTSIDMKIDYQKESDNSSISESDNKPYSIHNKDKNSFEESLDINVNSNPIEMNNKKLPLLDPISQFHGTYIIAQSEEGLYLIDQHAAHERINYEKNISKLASQRLETQELLTPLTIDYTISEIKKIENIMDKLNEYGIEIELFGQQTIMIRSVPTWIPKDEEKIFIENMIEKLLQNKDINIMDLRKDIIASISCKSSLKGNQYISKKEMEILLEQLRETANPFSCPHGRPIIIFFSEYDIEKMFKRVK